MKTGEYPMPAMMGAVKREFWGLGGWQGSGKYSVIRKLWTELCKKVPECYSNNQEQSG